MHIGFEPMTSGCKPDVIATILTALIIYKHTLKDSNPKEQFWRLSCYQLHQECLFKQINSIV